MSERIVIYGTLRPTYKNAHIITIKCPHCRKKHHHGWPSRSAQDYTPQRREAHCDSEYGGPTNPDYWIAPLSGELTKR